MIGRSPDCQIVLKDFGISRTHAKLVVDEDGVRILDLKSKNGTRSTACPWWRRRSRTATASCSASSSSPSARALEGKVVLDEAKPLSEEAGTIIRSVGELSASCLSDEPGSAEAVAGRQEGPRRRPGDREVEPHPEGPDQGRGDADRGAAGGGGAAAGHGHRLRPRARRPRLPDARARTARTSCADGGQAPQREPASDGQDQRSRRRSPTA